MDPRTPLAAPENRPARTMIPWTFVWMGALTLVVASVIAWVLLNHGRLMPTGNGNGNGGGDEDNKKDRAVAIAYVDVEKGITQLYPVRPGRVVEVYVNEGDEVEADQPLVKIDDSLAREQLAEAELALDGAKVRKKQAEKMAEQQKDAEHAQEKKVAIRDAEVAEAQANLAKAKRYYQERLGGSAEDVRIAEETVKKAKAAVEAEKAELARIEHLDVTVGVEAAEVDVKAKERQISKAKLDLKNYVLRSPSKGKILRSYVNVGEAMGSNPQRPAMEFAPAGDLSCVRRSSRSSPGA